MKSHLFRASSILGVLVLLVVALGLSGTAQEPTTRQQQEQQIIDLPVQQLDAEALRISVPRECERIRPEVQIHDVADTFGPPGTPLLPSLSPALTNYLVGKPIKGYDDPRVNRIFVTLTGNYGGDDDVSVFLDNTSSPVISQCTGGWCFNTPKKTLTTFSTGVGSGGHALIVRVKNDSNGPSGMFINAKLTGTCTSEPTKPTR